MARRIKLRGWRKIATATWGLPADPQIYGDLDIDAAALLAFASRVQEKTGERVTLTHLIGKAVAHALATHPELNARLYRGRFVQRDQVDIFFIAATGGGDDLSGVKVEHTDRKSVIDVARELRARTERIRAGEDEDLGKTKALLEVVSPRVLGWLLRLVAWLTVDRDLDLRKYGLPRQAFGSAMVTSVGMFGIQHAYAPLSPYYRVPFLVLVGEVTERPVAVEGTVVVRNIVSIAATIDHRYMDGFHAAKLATAVREYCADPARFEPALG
jgi:pyruvate/2-oxoglutarate dehydrogenase complex dihydrolipoamide acyltransferase (E2) component